jgi:hypothetical protein
LSDDLLYARGACTGLVITCSDFRFKSIERQFLEGAGLVDDYDLIARPGAIRSLVAPRPAASRDTMEDEIRLLWKLHAFTRVLIVNHLSFRAYDDLTAGGEREIHLAHLHTARTAIEQLCDGAAVEPYLISAVDTAFRVERVPAS